MSRARFIIGVVVALALVGGAWRAWSMHRAPFEWRLPPDFPRPIVPADNPMSAAKVELGRRLFYDARLSRNQTQSCASCHQQARAFTDGRAHAIGCTGERNRRSSMSLVNVAYAARLTWANPLLDRLEDQALIPMFGDEPVELGLSDAQLLLSRLAADEDYQRRFRDAFAGDEAPLTLQNVTRALASFERTIVSGDSAYDRFTRGDTEALSDAAYRGLQLFLSERLECFHCHGGFNFSDAVNHAGLVEAARVFHNNGLYDVDGRGAYPARDRGLVEATGDADDTGKFVAPTLRNIAVTAPYMHDGSLATLDAVIEHYARGGMHSRRQEAFVRGFVISDGEKRDLIAFLDSLTDEQLLHDPRFADPRRSPDPESRLTGQTIR